MLNIPNVIKSNAKVKIKKKKLSAVLIIERALIFDKCMLLKLKKVMKPKISKEISDLIN